VADDAALEGTHGEVPNAALERAATILSRARRVLVFSGAGISAESGVATFRDAGGLWERHSIEEVATLAGFRRNPTLVGEFYESRRRGIAAVEPNDGHRAIVRLARLVRELTVVTQNVDGLHQRAGSTDVIEIHGSLHRARCADDCGHVVDPFPTPCETVPPRCICGGWLRPDVVWFGEMLPEAAWNDAMTAAAASDVALVVGTSGAVWPAAGIPLAAGRHGAVVVEVNPERSELSDAVDLVLRGRSGALLPRLVLAAERLARGGADRAAREDTA